MIHGPLFYLFYLQSFMYFIYFKNRSGKGELKILKALRESWEGQKETDNYVSQGTVKKIIE